MTRLNPRMKVNDNGTVTLSGVSVSDMRSILTAAWLWRDQEADKITGPDSLIWDRRIKAILKMLEPPKYRSGYEFVPLSQLKPHEIAVRRRDVRSNRHFRMEVERVLAAVFEQAARNKKT